MHCSTYNIYDHYDDIAFCSVYTRSFTPSARRSSDKSHFDSYKHNPTNAAESREWAELKACVCVTQRSMVSFARKT